MPETAQAPIWIMDGAGQTPPSIPFREGMTLQNVIDQVMPGVSPTERIIRVDSQEVALDTPIHADQIVSFSAAKQEGA